MQVVSQQYGMHIFRDSAVMNDFLFAGLLLWFVLVWRLSQTMLAWVCFVLF
jgi:hypothetical protein